jgi:hypothetical protein
VRSTALRRGSPRPRSPGNSPRRPQPANTVKFLLTAFTDYSDAIDDVRVPDRIASRDAKVFRAAAKTAGSAPPAPETPKASEHDLTSPVAWLTDAQFAALSHQDRAHIRVAAEIPLEQLRPRAGHGCGPSGRLSKECRRDPPEDHQGAEKPLKRP